MVNPVLVRRQDSCRSHTRLGIEVARLSSVVEEAVVVVKGLVPGAVAVASGLDLGTLPVRLGVVELRSAVAEANPIVAEARLVVVEARLAVAEARLAEAEARLVEAEARLVEAVAVGRVVAVAGLETGQTTRRVLWREYFLATVSVQLHIFP